MKTYYDNDADLTHLKGRCIGVIGYGIQGRAQALNLRDSGCRVVIGNIKDHYYDCAREDGFSPRKIAEVAKDADIIMVLIPDQAQKQIYKESILPNLDRGNMLIFAHGYSIHYKEIKVPKNVDVCLLAPRMPGEPIREYYRNGGGVPAFIDVYQDHSGRAWEIVLAVAKAIGITRAGAMAVTFKEETEIDLFIEQFLLPIIIRAIRLSFDVLINTGFTPEATLMELYSSGEIGELMMMAANTGIYRVWKNNASPTCQFGIFRNSEKVLPTEPTVTMIQEVLEGLRNGSFVQALSNEAHNGYASLHKYDEENEECILTQTQDRLKQIIRYRPNN